MVNLTDMSNFNDTSVLGGTRITASTGTLRRHQPHVLFTQCKLRAAVQHILDIQYQRIGYYTADRRHGYFAPNSYYFRYVDRFYVDIIHTECTIAHRLNFMSGLLSKSQTSIKSFKNTHSISFTVDLDFRPPHYFATYLVFKSMLSMFMV